MLKRGDQFEVYANQAMREAWVLSVVMAKPGHHMSNKWGGQALVEYAMPMGRTFLRILDLNEDGEVFGAGRPISYEQIPVKFLADMRSHFSEVLGLLQGGFDKSVPSHHYQRRYRAMFEREERKALAVRARVLDLKVPNQGGDHA